MEDAVLKLRFAEADRLTLLGLSATFYDLNLLYDWSVLVAVPEYEEVPLSSVFWYRSGRPIRREHALRVQSVHHESPVALEVVIPLVAVAAGAAWALVQVVNKIHNWPLDRRKLKGEVDEIETRARVRLLEEQTAEAARDEASFRRDRAAIEMNNARAAIEAKREDPRVRAIEEGVIRRLENDDLTVVDAEFVDLDDPQQEGSLQ